MIKAYAAGNKVVAFNPYHNAFLRDPALFEVRVVGIHERLPSLLPDGNIGTISTYLL